jgi:tetratricopeptide (TPR) repeat protein
VPFRSWPPLDNDWVVDERAAESLLISAEEAGPGLRGLNAKAVFEELERRYGDLLAALDWFIDERRADEALRLATSLTPLWTATKRVEEGSALLDRTLALAFGEAANRGRVSFDAGMLAFWQGDDERSAGLHRQALELGRQANDPTVTALGLGGLARVALRAGDIDDAGRLCREALSVSEGTADRSGRSGALHVLGVAAQMAGDLLEARELMMERLALMRELENYAGISSEAGNLSMVERQLGHLDNADELAREALDIDYRRGDELPMPWKLNRLAAVATERGEFERAATLIGAADGMLEAQGAAWPPDERVTTNEP